MAVHTNGQADTVNINEDIGAPLLDPSDVISIVKGGKHYNTNLDSLGTTMCAEFNSGAGYSGNLGNYPQGLLIPALAIHLADKGRKHALRTVADQTTNSLHLAGLSSPEVTLHDFHEITLLEVLTPQRVRLQGSAVAITARAVAPGVLIEAEANATAIDVLGVDTGGKGAARGISERNATAASIGAGCELVTRLSAAVGTLNNTGGTFKQQGEGGLTTVNAGPGSVYDFRQTQADISSIAWVITGPITIYEPPPGVTVDMPTPGEAGDHEVRYFKR